MNVFTEKFLREQGSAAPTLALAAFGKHPGWNDHLDDFGFETESLAQAKQLIYLQGLARQIDSAAWDELPEEKRLAGFNHIFLWSRRQGFIAGNLWSSQDGKGRTKYPMVVAVHVIGLPASWAISVVFPALDQLKAKCRAAVAAPDVIQALTACREQLRRELSHASTALGAQHLPALPPGCARVGLHRILYEISSQMKPFAPGATELRGVGQSPSRRLRVNAASADALALASWMRLVTSQLEEDVPVLALAARDANTIDFVVGEPTAQDFFCLRASQKQVPATTDVPYNLEPGFVSTAEAVIEDLSASRDGERTIFGPRKRSGLTLFPWAVPTRSSRSSPESQAVPPAVPSQKAVAPAAPRQSGIRWITAVFILLGLGIIGITLYVASSQH